jgi:hypothetical protein
MKLKLIALKADTVRRDEHCLETRFGGNKQISNNKTFSRLREKLEKRKNKSAALKSRRKDPS